jgi:hypothetical protein
MDTTLKTNLQLEDLIEKLITTCGNFLEDKKLFADFIVQNEIPNKNIQSIKIEIENQLLKCSMKKMLEEDYYGYEYNFLLDHETRKKILDFPIELYYSLFDKLLNDFSNLCGIKFSNWEEAYQEAKKIV